MHPHSESVGQTKVGSVTGTGSGRASVQTETDKLEDSVNRNLKNFSKKGRALPLGWNNLTH